ncbi:hypothetical protein BGW41_000124 [Actinomortierella wolfii]|nr:hypothetical protein BGW41_000124 [Actinomortierella wolfii]
MPAMGTAVARLGYQLPSKQVQFAILVGNSAQPEDQTHATDSSELDQQRQKENELLAWIRENGWSVPFVFYDSPEFWETMEDILCERYQQLPSTSADLPEATGQQEVQALQWKDDDACRPKLGILTVRDEQRVLLPPNLVESESVLQKLQRAMYRPYLFKPNPWLAKTIITIERDLLRTRASSADKDATFRCLDLGCGAGRDMTYLVSRALNNLQPNRTSPQWSLLGIDSFIGACEKSVSLAKTTLSYHQSEEPGPSMQANEKQYDYAARVSTLVAKIDSKTGVLWVDRAQLEPLSAPPLILANVRYHDQDLDEQCTAALSSSSLVEHSSSSCTTLPAELQQQRTEPFDLIVMIRFLERNAMAPIVEHWLAPGGFLLLSHFVQDKDLPVYTKPGPHHRLQSKTEARDWFMRLGLEIVMEEISTIEDGRPVSNTLARKPLI